MTMRDLEVFLAVAENGSMSQAAAKLYITQPSVSLVIKSLEEGFHVRLFERSGKKLILTNTGLGLVQRAKKALSAQRSIQDYLCSEAENRWIHIGATATIGSSLISEIVLELTQRYPESKCEVLVANTHIIEEKLLEYKLDIALVEGRIRNPELLVKAAVQDELVLICSSRHAFFGRASVKMCELGNQPMILREEGSGTREQVEEKFHQYGVNCNVIWSCYQVSAIKDAVMRGLGISIISKRLVWQECENDLLWSCPIEDVDFCRTFNLVYHKDKYFSKQMACFDQICTRFSNLRCCPSAQR